LDGVTALLPPSATVLDAADRGPRFRLIMTEFAEGCGRWNRPGPDRASRSAAFGAATPLGRGSSPPAGGGGRGPAAVGPG
jgi:hypothetical protein